MAAADAILAWRDFYGAVANAAAALLGLVFVGVALHLGMRRDDRPLRSLATGSAITLLQPLLVALVMLIPSGVPALHGAGLVVLAVVVVVELGWVFRVRATHRADSRFWLMYRSGIPLVASGVLFLGGIGLASGVADAILAPALFVFAMFVVGVQDAFDLLMGQHNRSSPDGHRCRDQRSRASSGLRTRFVDGPD